MKSETIQADITTEEIDAVESLIELAVADMQYNDDPQMMADVELALSLLRKISL